MAVRGQRSFHLEPGSDRKFPHKSTVIPIPTRTDLRSFIAADLDVKRLVKIKNLLWFCGRPVPPRSLHRQQLLGRKILQTEQADLHLLYVSPFEDKKTIFIKPLPAYILSQRVWDLYICKDCSLHKDACGFLLSYIWLIRSQLDFKLAENLDLLPNGLEWTQWRMLSEECLENIEQFFEDRVSPRYHFGELKRTRIDAIYRFTPRFFLRYSIAGYFYEEDLAIVFYKRQVAWLVVAFAFFSLILSAMQVGLAVAPLNDNHVFGRASYGFVVFTIFLVAVTMVIVVCVFVGLWIFDKLKSISQAKKGMERRLQNRMGEKRHL
ncbi:hypothetical protein AOQ84DRAFT_431399 [Glonium stellatum]|uniref:Uncharacterized protein n=1 Tax=Glonium stellatum TaxID=574774 RepID=A0A8E2JU54_9PEZI|nr:hypothetical protein AOQ84DRAFT_431399 [Glonium stellatum]